MDPTTTVIDLLVAIFEGNDEKAKDLFDDYMGWRDSGGFLPTEGAVCILLNERLANRRSDDQRRIDGIRGVVSDGVENH